MGSGQEQGSAVPGVSQESTGSSDTWEAAPLPALLETVALAVHLQDVNVVGEPVKQSAGEPLGAEHVGPLVEGQVGGDQDGAPFVALAEDLEEEFRTGGGEGDEAQLVDDEKPEAGQLPLQVEQPAIVLWPP